MKRRRLSLAGRLAATVATVLVFTLLAATEAFAQCPLCKAAVQNAGLKMARALNLGIIILLIPPVTIFCSIFVVAFKRRRATSDDAGAASVATEEVTEDMTEEWPHEI